MRVLKLGLTGVFVVGLLAPGVTWAAASSPERGAALVQKWCTSCHADAKQRILSDQAPSLADLAHENQSKPSWVKTWLTAPHPPMTGIELTRTDISDIQAYLRMIASGS